ncbi:MAG: hypothetical protein JWO08_2515 [Verrucomicrobiaceae bacterium]|nr:hypothetical protein [Verrucomicrobiaceae bacterium]
MIGRNYLFFSVALGAIGWLSLCSFGQSVAPTPKSTVTTPTTRPELTPEQKRSNELYVAFYKRRRQGFSTHSPSDNASRLLAKVSSGEVTLDNRDQRSLTKSLLAALDVPVSSQLLVYSGTASQGTKVNPKNPRALYFNDEVYVGVVPGGLVEMIGVDANIGGVPYTFRQVGTGSVPSTTGGEDCIRCHSGAQSGFAQGFFGRSLVPTEDGFIQGGEAVGTEGHNRPLGRRFGGWFVTSARPDVFGKAGLVAETEGTNRRRVTGYKMTRPGQLYDAKLHLAESSDILAHLLHEHQIGFHNRVARVLMSADDDGCQEGVRLSPTHAQDITNLVAYMLFQDEATLPAEGIVGDPKFAEDFSRNRRPAKSGAALKDLDLHTRLLKHRCTYMIYTRPWMEMPAKVKGEIYAKLRSALMGKDYIGSHLSDSEKREIVQILSDTVPDLPADWKSS